MKKLLLASVAVGGLALAAAPAYAEIDLEIGGFFKGYGAYVDQDETAGQDTQFDILRQSELHFGGETTLDNGLTVGAHIEFEIDGGDTLNANESYVYFSGNWGRTNFGVEDGAAYLLQVAAPSADSNIDGLRQYVQPFASAPATGGLTPQAAAGELDYDHSPTGNIDKFTYLTPIISGLQGGISFTPDSSGFASSLGGVDLDTGAVGTIQETYELAVRYEGQYDTVGVIAGAGFTHGEQEATSATVDDRQAWNVGLDLDIGPFGIGASYSEDDLGFDGTAESDREILVIGADYTTGPFKIGASYYNQDNDSTTGIELDRYTGGVNYQYGPGMSFRGSIQYLDQDNPAAADADGTAVMLGTQINF